MRTLFQLLNRFGRNKAGNVAVIFTLSLLPVISAVGCAVDYSQACRIRTKLIAASDAASVGSVAVTSPAFIAAGAMTSDGPVAAGAADAATLFNGNIANLTGYTLNSVTAAVAKSGSVITSNVQFSANVPTMFLGVLGMSEMTVTGTSTATANLPLYIDFYLLLDNSPSMSVGATPADVQALVNATSSPSYGANQYCAFACHDVNPGSASNLYPLAQSLGITTRIDVLSQATANLMVTAGTMETYSNQYRMAIYDFGATADTAGLTALFPLSSSLNSAATAAANIQLMTVNSATDYYQVDTPFTPILAQINSVINSPGTGTSSAPLKYLFFVSDGVADENNSGSTMCNAYPSSYPLYVPYNRCQSAINPALCTTLKNRGIKVAVLYTTYLALPTSTWYMTYINGFNAGPYGPSPNSQIAQNMQSCASPGLYFEVSPTQGISQAMNALFQIAISNVRISG
jgi:Flp pilus assembly protein TadG